jgi:plasmid stabilization system protein ParE
VTKSKYNIRLLKIAEEDLNEIISYIALDNPDAAENLANKIETDLMLLSSNPHLGRIPRDEEIRKFGYRYLILENYLIFYTIEEKTIFIHRIIYKVNLPAFFQLEQ